ELGNIASGRAEVHQNPWDESAYLRDFVDHDELMLVDVDLLLFCPAFFLATVYALLCLRAKLGDEDRLLRQLPLNIVGLFRTQFVPANVFVLANYIESISKWVVLNHLGSSEMRADQR